MGRWKEKWPLHRRILGCLCPCWELSYHLQGNCQERTFGSVQGHFPLIDPGAAHPASFLGRTPACLLLTPPCPCSLPVLSRPTGCSQLCLHQAASCKQPSGPEPWLVSPLWALHVWFARHLGPTAPGKGTLRLCEKPVHLVNIPALMDTHPQEGWLGAAATLGPFLYCVPLCLTLLSSLPM